jgi:hypothetical protein
MRNVDLAGLPSNDLPPGAGTREPVAEATAREIGQVSLVEALELTALIA